jgi:2-polyprenyl-3-methyl-5-hydroxy-6-metoxy-1,4-benzoquinol methylase
MKEQNNSEYYDKKWLDVINKMPNGGNYSFDKRKHGYQIIVDYIGKSKSIFDYACGLGVIDLMLSKNRCKVAGCDFSGVAVNYCSRRMRGDFRVTGELFGGFYDYIIAIYFLEHIKNPVEFLQRCFKHTDKIICALPNNFNRTGEHIDMAWGNWDDFYELFSDFSVTRIDEGKYPSGLINAFKHPIFLFEEL